jgi:hypothetical protein
MDTANAQDTWSANLLNQSALGSSVFNARAANQRVMAKGDRAKGFNFPKLGSESHELFPGTKP